MQAVFYEREKFRLSNEQRDQSRTESKIITRKQGKRTSNIFKKKKDDEEAFPIRDKRCHSSQQLKFVKSHSAAEEKDHGFITNNQESTNSPQKEKGSSHNSPVKQSPKIDRKKSLVFNKFTHQEREQVRELLTEIKNVIDDHDRDGHLKDFCMHIEAYITKIEQNNSKLLEVNYFFQKEFNEIMAEKQLAKRIEKCSKNYCMECRYHLEKENRWNQEKIELQQQIARLKEELSSVQTSKIEESSPPSIMAEQGSDSSLLKLREQLEEKDEEYMILLKEFNYLDAINKDLKSRMARVMEQYKYLSIENRTLLNTKTKLIQKQVQCTKYKDERDYFKRKVIDYHKKNEQNKQKTNCNCKNTKQEESIFSLSSVSNDLSALPSTTSTPLQQTKL